MLIQYMTILVLWCHRNARIVVTLSMLFAIGGGAFVVSQFKMNTDINQLLADDLPWRREEKRLEQQFPQYTDTLLIVVEGPSAALSEKAATQLASDLKPHSELFTSVTQPDDLAFFRQNGLLYLDKKELSSVLDGMIHAQPLMGTLVTDPSLRGIFSTLGMMGDGVTMGAIDRAQLDKPLSAFSRVTEAALQNKDQILDWQDLMQDQGPSLREIRKYIMTKPILDYSLLEPGAHATKFIRDWIASHQSLAEEGVRIHLTGPVPLNDEEFSSVADGTKMATLLSLTLVLTILGFALRSLRLILPILLTLTIGLIATTAFALLAIGSLNLISVAFAVMFIGIAVDFGIQIGVRYRDHHFREPLHTKALKETVSQIALPLSLAAGSTALGFLAFVPTAYRGVSELGLIAGVGMLIAFTLNLTLLPALMALAQPPAEREAIGFRKLIVLDRFLEKKRHLVIGASVVLAILSLVAIRDLRFDFDPLNLKDPKTESVRTLFESLNDPDFSPYTIDILVPSLLEVSRLSTQLESLPSIDHVLSLQSFIPDDQDNKLKQINDTRDLLEPTLSLPTLDPPSVDEEWHSLDRVLSKLDHLQNSPSLDTLKKALGSLAQQRNAQLLQKLKQNILEAWPSQLKKIGEALSAQRITLHSLPAELREQWLSKDGVYRIEIYPKGNPRDYKVLTSFTKDVRSLAPEATGTPISIEESGRTVTDAFKKAGINALFAIALLTLLILRKVREVIVLITPLLLAGLLTLATCALLNLPLNFANIIALPLLLSLGVSYAIYFVSYWRMGHTNPLQSSMARAVLFSAATTFVAFGTLSLSTHPGTASMGKLLSLALLYSLLCTFLVLPALLGSPPKVK